VLLFFVDIQIIRYRTDTPLWAVGYRPRSAPLNARPSDGPHSIFVWKIGSGAIIERITNCAPSTSNAHNAGKMPNMQIADVFSIGIRSGIWYMTCVSKNKTNRVMSSMNSESFDKRGFLIRKKSEMFAWLSGTVTDNCHNKS
jgi:hypothetical protein